MSEYNPLDHLGCLNHMGDPSQNCTGCYAVLLDEANELKAEIAKLREDKAKVIRKAWYASGAWNLGGMMGFVQRHPNLDEYLKRELGE